jgi:hypothetical protein
MAVDKEIYPEVFACCDWDTWCNQFIKKDGKSNVDPVPAERETESSK